MFVGSLSFLAVYVAVEYQLAKRRPTSFRQPRHYYSSIQAPASRVGMGMGMGMGMGVGMGMELSKPALMFVVSLSFLAVYVADGGDNDICEMHTDDVRVGGLLVWSCVGLRGAARIPSSTEAGKADLAAWTLRWVLETLIRNPSILVTSGILVIFSHAFLDFISGQFCRIRDSYISQAIIF